MGRYAMVYTQTNVFPQTVTQTPVALGYISAYSIYEGAEAEVGSNSLRVKVPGKYLITASVSLTSDTADNFYVEIYKNGISTGFRSGVYVTSDGLAVVSAHGILNLDPKDVVTLWISSASDASYSITVGSAQFSMVSI